MTSIHTYDPADGAVPPELPPMNLATMAVGRSGVLDRQETCPTRLVSIYRSSQSFALQFAPGRASLKALTRWALRFGAVLVSQPYDGENGPETWCRAEFEYYGVPVHAYAFIPAEPAAA